MSDRRYWYLWSILDAAYKQASSGKGAERHGDDRPWEDQISGQITRTVGLGFPIGQAIKKATEATRLLEGENGPARCEAELLGAIVYLALAVAEVRRRGQIPATCEQSCTSAIPACPVVTDGRRVKDGGTCGAALIPLLGAVAGIKLSCGCRACRGRRTIGPDHGD